MTNPDYETIDALIMEHLGEPEVLEADAEVIEAILHKDGKRYWINDCNKCKTERCYPTLEQFNAEWEEVK
jgi:hypothetical protein